MKEPLLGAHVSSAGGMPRAVDRAVDLGVSSCQIFVKSPSQWRGRRFSAEEVARFRRQRGRAGLLRVVAHGTYLLNLAATDPANRERSVATLADEIERSTALGLDGLVIHPGAHLGSGEPAGLARIARALERVLEQRPDDTPPILLENTAGQGTVLGYRIQQLGTIVELCPHGERLHLCLDTCHAFAAGYAIDEAGGLDELLGEIDQHLGLGRLAVIHLNDSRHRRGSRRDRHANLGAGRIGLDAFERLLFEPRLAGVPMILETPLGKDGDGHRRDLETLRAMLS
ncbi:MAG: deoxyribonuclease IV [Thermoanaerobaculia bacterium]|nr:deoxyribonuclease IV [Thermoanaerobaculia bacterium]